MRDMFMQSLHNIYLDIHVLNRMGYSGEYVERMTALERGIYIKYKEIENAQTKNEENKGTLSDMGIDPDMLL